MQPSSRAKPHNNSIKTLRYHKSSCGSNYFCGILCDFEHDIRNAVHAAEVVFLDELVAPVVQTEADQVLFFRAEREPCALAGLQRL